MKKINLSYLFLLLFIPTGHGFTDKEALKIFKEANNAYQKINYEKSIQQYEKLISNQSVSPEVFYNLGNSYFKSGNFAKAILNYERARKFSPDDEDINFNLKIASLKVIDKIENVPEIFYKNWINQLSQLFQANIWSVILILFTWLLFMSAAFYVFGSTVAAKKISFILVTVSLFFTIATGIIASKSHSISVDEQAIVMESSVYVKSSPDEKGIDQFILHEGTKVEVLDKLNNWKKIRIANGNIGWLKSEELEKI